MRKPFFLTMITAQITMVIIVCFPNPLFCRGSTRSGLAARNAFARRGLHRPTLDMEDIPELRQLKRGSLKPRAENEVKSAWGSRDALVRPWPMTATTGRGPARQPELRSPTLVDVREPLADFARGRKMGMLLSISPNNRSPRATTSTRGVCQTAPNDLCRITDGAPRNATEKRSATNTQWAW